MANECSNYIQISGESSLLEIFAESYFVLKYEGTDEEYFELDFNAITPIPKDCENDYDFRIQNWGNKWDGTNGTVYYERGDNLIDIGVETAWGPCVPIIEKLIELCPGLDFYHEYYEPGCAFAGYIKHIGGDDPDDYEHEEYSADYDKERYWVFVFEKELESLDWLYDYINDEIECEALSEEDGKSLLEDIENAIPLELSIPLELLVKRCIEKGVL